MVSQPGMLALLHELRGQHPHYSDAPHVLQDALKVHMFGKGPVVVVHPGTGH
ncbi:hypothetical protein [Pyxidicoccus caerfyrddinensis]|uniref:hypothetical protein n=1 Tax=Pyxidicoccus caerfyrddinensis TaxID=2709663 RepID=UPI0013DC23E5|nr:hypothetical protein [Pyxidicoccus caerfyrddinensis]